MAREKEKAVVTAAVQRSKNTARLMCEVHLPVAWYCRPAYHPEMMPSPLRVTSRGEREESRREGELSCLHWCVSEGVILICCGTPSVRMRRGVVRGVPESGKTGEDPQR